MTIKQLLNERYTDKYDNEILVMGIPQGYFPAIISTTLSADQTTRLIRVDLLALEQSPGGDMNMNTGGYFIQEGEKAVKVSVYLEDQLQVENTEAY